MINFFQLNYDPKVRALSGGSQYGNKVDYIIYRNKPTESDAWRIGDGVESRLNANLNKINQ